MIKENKYKILFFTAILIMTTILFSGCLASEDNFTDNSIKTTFESLKLTPGPTSP